MKALLSALLTAGLVGLAAEPVVAQQEWSFEGDEVLVSNLIGEVTVRGHDGARIVVRVRPGGGDAGILDYRVKQGGSAEFHVVYPLADVLDYDYPRRRGGRTEIRVGNWRRASSFMEDLYSGVSSRDEIEIRGGRGAEAWADLEILVPRGVKTHVRLAVGEVEARDVQADIFLDTYSGPARAMNITGRTHIDTGSGSVAVSMIRGDLHVDTGSGRVEAEDVQGDDILIDTGSGSVTLDRATGRSVKIDTGSGSVTASEIDADDTVVNTGSGSVTLDLVRMGTGRHLVDTGSGRVTVYLPEDASCRITADTGSGGIELDIPNAQLRRMSRDHIELMVGDGAGDLEIDTGSGSIAIRRR
ncbi:MAG: DUF4097 domain-containing protein [Gemmatimonadetes bacterium]|uniref:DUF4097 domain-containing protein n=1 Tax=Candidatus Kutchimonas denitrificans TaxID=3056748 RepID=A0AAE4Z9I0_9BACT|nr:DUF4097 domain-containing protein [Gemmatimonadota bacterium]NIR73976.1 DUF4097 domain-containing protein [Candidatus Kutchimonas denitrificans]NIS02965.1 DUF4097 domain-containing protein [Gemmatimonadota bacterium]NIT68682.1 DUF4097 domain-containing protein [Gemmatimonadota bacterium]NIU53263.1 DUF4097 family beta strand repeat protein [Gemmatimonadota bacterium]